uniref:Serpentine Receptor, class T n=1 Tax=Rhabditophanes sp. KR3021 TaxID=114890 RepID=A0AC35U9A7_9BILA
MASPKEAHFAFDNFSALGNDFMLTEASNITKENQTKLADTYLQIEINCKGITKYDCSMFNSTMLNDPSKKSFKVGLLYLTLGIIYIVIYIPFVFAMVKHIKISAYKIMLMLAVYDLIGLFVAGVMSGFFSIHGTIYCSNQLRSAFFGAFGFGSFALTESTLLLLILNRCLTLMFSSAADKVFAGNNTWYMLLLPFSYGMWTIWFTPYPMYTSWANTYLFDPYPAYIKTPPEDLHELYGNIMHEINNYGICGMQVLSYIVLFILYMWKYVLGFYKTESNIKKFTGVRLFIQTTAVCTFSLSTSGLFILMSHLTDVPASLGILAHCSWITSCGINGMIYLLMNSTLKDTIRKEFFGVKKYKVTTVAQRVP